MEENKCIYNPNNECIMEQRINMLEKDMHRNQVTHKEFFDRFEKLNIDYVTLQKDVSNMSNKIDEIYLDLKALMNVPNKRYETIITGIITAVIGIAIGYFMK